MNDRISLLEHRHVGVATAFPQNDLNKPDYDGHRKAHLKLMEDENVLNNYKQEATKKVIHIAITILFTLMLSGLFFELAKK